MDDYAAIVVTFRRPESLGHVIAGLVAQTHPPTLVMVADNDESRSAEAVVRRLGPDSSVPIEYLPTGSNLGASGGWATAARSARLDSRRGEWLLVVDDDDPLGHPEIVQRLLTCERSIGPDARCAAIGLRGAYLSRMTGRLRRATSTEGRATSVDYLGGGALPLYRWDAIDDVGFFDDELFFGFEDLDQGLRLRAGGWTVWSVSFSALHEPADTASTRTPWREYYKVRAMTAITRRYLGLLPLLFLLVRTVLLGSLKITISTRSFAVARARCAGFYDGCRARLGRRRFHPEVNPPKPSAHPRP